MKIRRLFQGFMMFLFLGASTAAMHAQSFSLFLEGAGSSPFDNRSYTVYGTAYGSKYNIGGGFTIGAEMPLTKVFSLEGAYGFVRNDLVVANLYNSTVPNQENSYGVTDQRVSVDILTHVPKTIKGLRPYLATGLEFDNFAPTSEATASANSSSPGFNGVPNTVLKGDDKVGFNVGGGMDINLTRRLAFRLDLRDHITGSPTFGLPSSSSSVYSAYYPITGLANDLEYSAGIVMRFGK